MVDSEAEKTALEEALGLVQQARDICRVAQKASIQVQITQGMEMQ